jgi:hypothetical protein
MSHTEHGLQGCFQQGIDHALGAAPEASPIDIYIGDFMCSGSTYQNIPNIVGLQDANGATEAELVGEVKAP